MRKEIGLRLMAIKNKKKTIKIRKGKTRGMGYLSWKRLEERFREIDELTEQQQLKSIYLNDKGIYYTTEKRSQ